MFVTVHSIYSPNLTFYLSECIMGDWGLRFIGNIRVYTEKEWIIPWVSALQLLWSSFLEKVSYTLVTMCGHVCPIVPFITCGLITQDITDWTRCKCLDRKNKNLSMSCKDILLGFVLKYRGIFNLMIYRCHKEMGSVHKHKAWSRINFI